MKKIITYIVTIILSISVGFAGMYALLYFYPQSIVNFVSKNEVTVTDKGISAGVEAVYDAVVVVETYNQGSLTGTGTGFVYNKDGKDAYIMTNHHVIEEGKEIKVIYSNDTSTTATLIASDEYADIAVLKVDASSILAIANLGSSESIKVGDTVFTIGAPMGTKYKGTVTRGILSGKDRLVSVSVSSSTSNDWIMKVMQTDAAINPGNSGGPICNVSGEVIGITSMKIVESSIEGIGFAIPIEDAKSIADMLLTGDIERPYIGLNMANSTETLGLMRYGIQIDKNLTGVVILNTIADSPAEKSGLEKGDIITKVGDIKVTSVAELRYYLYKYKVGEKVEITFNRNGKEKTVKVELGKSS